ncbi:uncharacterized protein LOC111592525 isoform X2 [Drosophila hydei]|uniref:Regulatory protein zeste n=1 Tax=Drosophila hydei TaxID=7224 RepID=A0A6J1L8L7_DROHY|nr:uncharacterized protein LOC111592525 isoform X2 [Drosophila hydei]
MNSRRQRSRMPNFTIAEENVLKTLTVKYHKEIEEKTSNAHVWRSKNRAWENIAVEFYNNTQIRRSAVKLKSKYETMKKLNKQSNGLVKKELALSSLNQDCEVIEEKSDRVDQAKLIDHIKAEFQANEITSLNDLESVDVERTNSELHASSFEADQIVSEEDKNQIPLAKAKSDSCQTAVKSPKTDSRPPTEKDVKDMREFLQQYTNINQSDTPIFTAKSNISFRETGKVSLHCTEEDNVGLVKDLTNKILRKKLFKSSFKQTKELSLTQRSLAAQFNYYRNMDIRAQQKHLAELRNLEVQHKILEIELKIKQKEFEKN